MGDTLTMSKVIFVSNGNRRELETQLGARLSNAEVILNSSRLQLAQPLPFPDFDGVRLANVARLETRWKGQDIFALESLSSTDWSNRDWKLSFFGEGPDKAYITDLIKMHNLHGRAELSGYVRDLLGIWRVRGLLALPSRGEGTPLACIEAMMCGRPVVATDVGGVAEILEDDVTGFIAEAPTARSLVVLWKGLGVPKIVGEMGHRAHLRARELEKSDPPQQLLTLYQRL